MSVKESLDIIDDIDDIDYLNGKTNDNKDNSDYTRDISDSNYDISGIFTSVNEFNNYLNSGSGYTFADTDTSHNDVLVKNVFDDHTNLIYQKSLNQNEYVKSIENRFKNLENNKINNELITRILKEETDIEEKEIDN